MKFRAVCKFNWSTIVPLDCEQRKRYTHKVSTINPGPQQVKRALSRMLHAVDRNRTFPSAGRGSQVCCDCKPESFPWCHGYAPIDLYDSSGAIIASFLRISYLVQHVKFRFGPSQGTPKIPAQVLRWNFGGPPRQTPLAFSCPQLHIMWVMSLLGDPKNSSAGPALEFGGPPKRDHQNSSKDLRTSQMRSPPPFFSSFCNT